MYEQQPQDTAQPSGTPPVAGSNGKRQDPRHRHRRVPAPGVASDVETTTHAADQAPKDEDLLGSEAPTATASTTAASSLGSTARGESALPCPRPRATGSKLETLFEPGDGWRSATLSSGTTGDAAVAPPATAPTTDVTPTPTPPASAGRRRAAAAAWRT